MISRLPHSLNLVTKIKYFMGAFLSLTLCLWFTMHWDHSSSKYFALSLIYKPSNADCLNWKTNLYLHHSLVSMAGVFNSLESWTILLLFILYWKCSFWTNTSYIKLISNFIGNLREQKSVNVMEIIIYLTFLYSV